MPKYRLTQTEPRNDGSGMIAWDIWATDDDGLLIPGKHMTILTPYDETQEALDGPAVGAKLIALLKANLPQTGWDNDSLSAIVAANENAKAVDSNLDDFIDGAGGYPIDFDA